MSGVGKQMTEGRKQKSDRVPNFSGFYHLSSDPCHLTSETETNKLDRNNQ